MFRSFIGDRTFYLKLFSITVPLVVQQLITTSVQLVDNVMVGRLGEEAISAVSVINQLYFVVILILFGMMGGAGIYTAQFFGSKDYDKLRQTFRFKVLMAVALSTASLILLSIFGYSLIRLFTTTELTVGLGMDYLNIVRFGVYPLALSIAISTTFREIGITKQIMVVSIIAVFVNTFLNYLLIFGNFGFPRLETVGAAYATLVARFVELTLMFVLLLKKGRLFSTRPSAIFRIDKKVLRGILIVALPLTLNEALWSLGQTGFLHAYSTRGDSALAAMNITNAISQLVFVTFAAIGTGVAVLVGNTLGSNQLEQARENAKKLIAASVVTAVFAGMILFVLSFFIVDLYDITLLTRTTAIFNIRVNAFFIPVFSLNVALYFTLRAGGDTRSTLMMDSGYMWVIAVPIALVLAYFTQLPITLMYILIQSLEVPKSLFAIHRYKKGRWLRNLAVPHKHLESLG